MNLKYYGSKHICDPLLPCVAGSVSWLVFCSLVSIQSRQFFLLLQAPEWAKNIEGKVFFRALMSQEGDVQNEMPLGEGQENSTL